jgi:predicted aldo/keto reductase-like oxidoreductase
LFKTMISGGIMDGKNKMKRRRFLRDSAAGLAGAGLITHPGWLGAQETSDSKSLMIKEYRTLGRTGFKVSDISFGGAGLTEPSVFEAALKAGINYVDTAEHYVRGGSEKAIGQVLKKGVIDRKKLFISTKLNISRGEHTKESIKERVQKSLERLQTDYIDCLQIHMVPTVEQIKHDGFHSAYEELKAEGRVRFLGLSCHGNQYSEVPVSMEEILLAGAADGRFAVVLFVYNFLQKEQGERILAACKSKQIGTSLMKVNPVIEYKELKAMFDERFKDGADVPEQAKKMLDLYKTRVDQSVDFKKKYNLDTFEEVTAAAIRFGLSHPDVHTSCPSISNFKDLENYVSLSGTKLDKAEAGMLAEYKVSFGDFYCRHACGACESQCPHGVPVSTIMRYNHYFVAQRREKRALEKYAGMEAAKADRCSLCAGHCQGACPFGVPIQGLLVAAHQTLTLA